MKRDTTTRKLQGGGETVVGVWRKVGADHFAFALALLRLAAIISPNSTNFDFVIVGDHDSIIQAHEDNGNSKIEKSKIWEDVYYNVGEDGAKEPIGTRFF